MFGNFSNRTEGFVFVSTETADAAEAIVFKVDTSHGTRFKPSSQFPGNLFAPSKIT